MLYSNVQLARVNLHAWQVTGTGFFRTITEAVFDDVVWEMTCIDASIDRQQLRPQAAP